MTDVHYRRRLGFVWD